MPDQDAEQEKSIPNDDGAPNQLLVQKHSLTGIASFLIGAFNLFVFGFSSYLGYRGTPFRLLHSLELVVICVIPFFGLWD